MKVFVLFLAVTAAAVDGFVNECPPEQANDWTIEKLLRHEDCEKFYKCTFGKPVEMMCPSNLWFNLDKWECDFPFNVDCTGRNVPTLPPPPGASTTRLSTTSTTPRPTTTTTTTTTTPRPTTTTTTTTTPRPTTTTTTTTTPRPTTTTTTTTTPRPTTTTTTTTTTPKPTTTTTTTTTPRPTTTTTTTRRPTTTTTTTTTPAPTTESQFLPNGCPVDPHIHWLLPHETNCNLFYYCVWGEKVLRECPSTLHFNRLIQVCDFPYRAGCSASLNKHSVNRREILASL